MLRLHWVLSHPDVHLPRQGPNLGGVNLVPCDVFDQIRSVPRLPSARSVHCAKALRSPMELAIPHRTTKSFSATDNMANIYLKKTTTFLRIQVDVRRGVERRQCCSSLMLNRCELRDCRIGCAGLGYISAVHSRLSRMLPPPHAARWS